MQLFDVFEIKTSWQGVLYFSCQQGNWKLKKNIYFHDMWLKVANLDWGKIQQILERKYFSVLQNKGRKQSN